MLFDERFSFFSEMSLSFHNFKKKFEFRSKVQISCLDLGSMWITCTTFPEDIKKNQRQQNMNKKVKQSKKNFTHR